MAVVRLADYLPAPYLLTRTDLVVRLFDDHALVDAALAFTPNPAAGAPADRAVSGPGLELRGVDLALEALAIDGFPLESRAYRLEPGRLLITTPPAGPFRLTSRVRIEPQRNTALEGLYVSGGLFTTQCEAEGFRRITFHPDRPDLLSCFQVRIEADRRSCPVLLSNGNCVETGDLPPDPAAPEGSQRHFAVWDDPYPKPSYLFALVGGDFRLVRIVEIHVGFRQR
jgi:aminopeptidase N